MSDASTDPMEPVYTLENIHLKIKFGDNLLYKSTRLRNSLAFYEVPFLFLPFLQKVSLKEKKNQGQEQNVNRTQSAN